MPKKQKRRSKQLPAQQQGPEVVFFQEKALTSGIKVLYRNRAIFLAQNRK